MLATNEYISEEREFTMDTNLLRDVITRQAGSISKAVVEGVMNLCEAGATEGRITLSSDVLRIEDNGRGFTSREEILEVFEVFGKSDARKGEDKAWAEFQMGRGQLMAFGITRYRTHTFEMIVDIRSCEEKIKYTLIEGLERVEGCTVTVELYDPVPARSLGWKCDEIRRSIRYVNLPLYLNDELISFPPDEQHWDFITDDAYIRIGGHGLSLYNLGVYVKSVSNKECGVGGTIVSRRRLKLNFARNDVIEDCPIWTRTAQFMREKSQSDLLKAKSPNEEQVNLIITNWRSEFFTIEDIYDCKLLRDTNDKRWSLAMMAEKGFPYFTLDDKQSLRADKAMQTGLGIVFNYRFTREAFRVSTERGVIHPVNILEELFEAAQRVQHPIKCLPPIQNLSPDELYEELEEANAILEEAELTPKERIILKVLNRWNVSYANSFDKQKPRRILLGISDTAYAWTDGDAYVVFDRRYMNDAVTSLTGWCKSLLKLAHEYAHLKVENLTHDDDFKERYERYSMRSMGYLEHLLSDYTSELKAAGRKVTKKLAKPRELIESASSAAATIEMAGQQ